MDSILNDFQTKIKALELVTVPEKQYYLQLLLSDFRQKISDIEMEENLSKQLLIDIHDIYRKFLGLKNRDLESIRKKMKTDISHNREHFILRLYQRYGIAISNDEYMKLCSINVIHWYKITRNTNVVELIIKDVRVLAIKGNSVNHIKQPHLITALPFGEEFEYNKLPVPVVMKRNGISNIEFWDAAKERWDAAIAISKKYDDEKKKEYFAEGNEKPQDEFGLYALGRYIALGSFNFGRLVNNTVKYLLENDKGKHLRTSKDRL